MAALPISGLAKIMGRSLKLRVEVRRVLAIVMSSDWWRREWVAMNGLAIEIGHFVV